MQKGSKSASTLGLQKKPFKKGILEKPTKSWRKKDQEKVKMMGETLVEAGFVKPIDSHFSQSSKWLFFLGMWGGWIASLNKRLFVDW